MTTLADLIENFACAQGRLSSVAYNDAGAQQRDSANALYLVARRSLFERLHLLVALGQRIEAYDAGIDAPGGDEGKARPPNGDDYNDVVSDVRMTLAALIGSDDLKVG